MMEMLQENIDELAMLETLDNGKPFKYARTSDLPQVWTIEDLQRPHIDSCRNMI